MQHTKMGAATGKERRQVAPRRMEPPPRQSSERLARDDRNTFRNFVSQVTLPRELLYTTGRGKTHLSGLPLSRRACC